jgi:putative transposase
MSNSIRIDSEKRKIKLPKLGFISYRDQRTIKDSEKIKSATISKSKTGKYFVSILVEFDLEHKGIKINKDTRVIGLDFSLPSFFIDNQGESAGSQKFYRNSQKKLAKLQKRVSKKRLGSKNRAKAQKKVNVVFEKITNCRKDWIHKLSSIIVRENDVIIVEDINLQGLAQAMTWGKAINDLGFGEFRRQLEYKALWSSKLFLKSDKWFASSQVCSDCGVKNPITKSLSVREWICEKCGSTHNRDINAAKNLQKWGLDFLGLGRPDIKPVEIRDSLVIDESRSVKQEALKSLVSE